MGSIFDALTPPSEDSGSARSGGIVDLLGLPDDQRELVTWMLRAGDVTLDQVSEHVGQPLKESEALLVTLEHGGYVQQVPLTDPPRFRTQRMAKRPSRLAGNLWRALDDSAAPKHQEP